MFFDEGESVVVAEVAVLDFDELFHGADEVVSGLLGGEGWDNIDASGHFLIGLDHLTEAGAVEGVDAFGVGRYFLPEVDNGEVAVLNMEDTLQAVDVEIVSADGAGRAETLW